MATSALGSQFKIMVDFNGTFYRHLRRIYNRSKNPLEAGIHLVKTALPLNQMVMVQGEARPIKDIVTLVFEGEQTCEKSQTSLKRVNARLKQILKLRNCLENLPVDKKVSKAKWCMIGKLERSTWHFKADDASNLQQELKIAGYNVEVACGEADVHIAKCKDPVVAVSFDSDLFMHKNVLVAAKPTFDCGLLKFFVLDRKVVCDKLNLTNSAWVALAVVSGNDYSDNVKGFGFGRNLKIIRKLMEAGHSDVKSIVSQYQSVMEVGPIFCQALRVFDSNQESLIVQSLEGDPNYKKNSLDNLFKPVEDEVFVSMGTLEWIRREISASSLTAAHRQYHEVYALLNLYSKWHESVLQLKSVKLDAYQEWKIQSRQVGKSREEVSYLSLQERWKGYNRFLPLYKKEFVDDRQSGTSVQSGGRYMFQEVEWNRKSKSEIPQPKKQTPKFIRDIESHEERQEESDDTTQSDDIEVAPRKKRRVQSSQTARRGNYRASSSVTRDKCDARSSGQKRINTEETLLMKKLKSAHSMSTLEVGSLRKCLSKGSLSQQLQKQLAATIQTVVRDINLLKRMAQLGVQWFIGIILEQYSDEISLLDDICYSDTPGQGGRKFWQGVIRFLRNGRSNASQKGAAVLKFGQLLGQQMNIMNGLERKFDRTLNITQIVDQLAIQLDSEFASQVIGRVELLAAQVLEHDPELRSRIEEIDKMPSVFQKFQSLNDLLPKERQYGYPLSSPQDCYVTFTENSMMMLLQSSIINNPQMEQERKQELLRDLQCYYSEGGLVKQKGHTLRECYGIKLKKGLRLLSQYMPEACDTTRKILSNTFITNGKVLKVHLIDIRRKQQVRRLAGSQSEGLLEAAQRKRLSKVTMQVSDTVKVQPDKLSEYWICCLDIGERYTAGIVAVKGQGESRIIRALALKSSAVNEPGRKFRKYHQGRPSNITQLERSMYRGEEESMECYWERYIDIYQQLRSYYSSEIRQKRHWDFKKAQRAEFDRATNAILKMVDASVFQKSNGQVVFGIGNAQFDSKQTIHLSFQRHFVQKVKSLGYPVVFLNEYLTSQKAPCCGCVCESFGMRIKYCRNCHKFYHRDIMAAENLTQVLICLICDEPRPKYLCSKNQSRSQESE
ncbi:hypothetical protein MP228_001458 [Amoeboaphelidium protococcarum]|nr:hypothetical protein MP228_001458 [Amoeboaphelidium protococcarum]